MARKWTTATPAKHTTRQASPPRKLADPPLFALQHAVGNTTTGQCVAQRDWSAQAAGQSVLKSLAPLFSQTFETKQEDRAGNETVTAGTRTMGTDVGALARDLRAGLKLVAADPETDADTRARATRLLAGLTGKETPKELAAIGVQVGVIPVADERAIREGSVTRGEKNTWTWWVARQAVLNDKIVNAEDQSPGVTGDKDPLTWRVVRQADDDTIITHETQDLGKLSFDGLTQGRANKTIIEGTDGGTVTHSAKDQRDWTLEGGPGYKSSSSGSVMVTDADGRETGKSWESSAKVGLVSGDEGGGLQASVEEGQSTTHADGTTTGWTTNGSGSVRWKVEPNDDGRLVFSLMVDVNARGTGKAGYGQASGSLSAGGGLKLSATRVLEPAQAEAVRGLLAAHGDGKDVAKLLAQLRSAGFLPASAGDLLGAATPEAALALEDGESSELEFRGEVGAGGELGEEDGPVKAGVSVSTSKAHKVKVERAGAKIRITVTVESGGSLGGSLGAAAGVAGAELSTKTTGGDAYAVTFEIADSDSGYRDAFLALSRCASVEQLVRAAADHPSLVFSSAATTSSTHNTGMTGVLYKVFGAKVGKSGSMTSTRMVEKGKLSGETRGSGTEDAGLEIFEMRFAGASTTAAVTAEAGEDGPSVDLSQTRSTVSLLDNVKAALTDIHERPLDAAYSLKDPKGALKARLERSQEHRSGIKLDPAGVDALVRRAADTRTWISHFPAGKLDEWAQLGRILADPRPPADLVASDHTGGEVAAQIVRNEALASFLDSAGPRGGRALREVLERWGEGQLTSTADDLGTAYEWPAELADLKAELDGLLKGVKDMPGVIEKARGNQLATTAVRGMLTMGLATCDSLASRLRQAGSITSERARADVLASVYRAKEEITRMLPLVGGADGGTLDLNNTGGVPLARFESLYRALFDFKDREKTLLAKDGDILAICREVYEMDQRWIKDVLLLRRAYEEAGVSVDSWKVSSGPGKPRTELEPDADALLRRRQEALDANARRYHGISALGEDRDAAISRQWRDVLTSY